MRQPDQIIILNTTKFGENSVILHCISKTYGRRGFIVKSAGKSNPFFQPLNILDCEIAENPKSSLFGAGSFFSAHPLTGIRGNYAKNAISIFVAEVLFRAIHEGSQDSGLYDWCVSEILLLDALEKDFANFHIRFLMDFAAALGFSPSLEALLPFMDNAATVAAEMVSGNFADSMLVRLSGAQRNELCARILKYIESHIESPLNIRSLQVLGELFQ